MYLGGVRVDLLPAPPPFPSRRHGEATIRQGWGPHWFISPTPHASRLKGDLRPLKGMILCGQVVPNFCSFQGVFRGGRVDLAPPPISFSSSWGNHNRRPPPSRLKGALRPLLLGQNVKIFTNCFSGRIFLKRLLSFFQINIYFVSRRNYINIYS